MKTAVNTDGKNTDWEKRKIRVSPIRVYKN
jgi:hypothetical protein